ncbi:MAG: 3-hydroxybutyryl-CoA dehydrogenase [Methylocystis sp.]
MLAEPSTIRTVGVIGIGQMGKGIAHVCARAGLNVRLRDLNGDLTNAGFTAIREMLAGLVSKGSLSDEDRRKELSLITLTTAYEHLAPCDLVIETATEDETVKREIFADICPALKPDTIIATNSSSISITRLAAATDRPERFIGMHFMNPAPAIQLVELVRGIATEDITFAVANQFVGLLGKTAVAAADFPAFIVNRTLVSMINEAVYVLYEGVGSVNAIDTAMQLGANHPMGPLELADFLGLDTCLSLMQALHEGLADTKYRPCPLLVKYVAAGWLGRKTKRGFYDYRGNIVVPTR